MMKMWFDRMSLWNSRELLFPGFRNAKDGVRKTVSGSWARSHIKKLVRANGLNPDFYSGHSLRAGGATDLFVARVPYFLIKKMGRWKSDAAMIYYRSEQDVVCMQFRRLSRSWLTHDGGLLVSLSDLGYLYKPCIGLVVVSSFSPI